MQETSDDIFTKSDIFLVGYPSIGVYLSRSSQKFPISSLPLFLQLSCLGKSVMSIKVRWFIDDLAVKKLFNLRMMWGPVLRRIEYPLHSLKYHWLPLVPLCLLWYLVMSYRCSYGIAHRWTTWLVPRPCLSLDQNLVPTRRGTWLWMARASSSMDSS